MSYYSLLYYLEQPPTRPYSYLSYLPPPPAPLRQSAPRALRSRLGAGSARQLAPSRIAQQNVKNQKPFSLLNRPNQGESITRHRSKEAASSGKTIWGPSLIPLAQAQPDLPSSVHMRPWCSTYGWSCRIPRFA